MVYLVYFLIFVLPLVVIPFMPLSFETPKVILAELLIEILVLWRLYKEGVRAFWEVGEVRGISKLGLYLIGGLFVLSLVQIVLTPTQSTFFGNVFRLQGVFLFWHLLALAVFMPPIVFSKWLSLIAFGSLLLLWGSTLIFGTTLNARIVGSLGEPNALAAQALLLWAFVAVGKDKKHILISTGIVIILLALSQSRSGIVAFFVEAAFLFLVLVLKRPYGKAVMVSFVLIAISYILPFLEHNRGGWYENRAEIWSTAVSAGLQSPFIGHGFGRVTEALKQESFRVGSNVQYQYVDSSHNFLLDVWVQGGMVGLYLLLMLIWITLSHAIRNKDTLGLTLLLGLITVMSFNPVSITSLVLFWWVIGRGIQRNLPSFQEKNKNNIVSF